VGFRVNGLYTSGLAAALVCDYTSNHAGGIMTTALDLMKRPQVDHGFNGVTGKVHIFVPNEVVLGCLAISLVKRANDCLTRRYTT